MSTLSIPNDVLQPIIDAHVAKAISEALGNRSDLIAAAVTAALTMKVDDRGNPTTYSNATTFLQWLVRDSIRNAATAAVSEYLLGDMQGIKAMVAKEMKNQRSPLVKSLIEGIAKGAAEAGRWSIKVSVDGVAS